MLLDTVRKCLKSLSARHRPGAPRSGRRHSPFTTLEPLENRCVPVVGSFSFATPVDPGTGFDGVVRVGFSGPFGAVGCTGTLLGTGRHILTAAHCVDLNNDGMVDAGSTVSVKFELPDSAGAGTLPIILGGIASSRVTTHPGYDGRPIDHGFDLAVIELPELAPVGAERYDLYRSGDEVGRDFVFVGYGMTGTGSTGPVPGTFGTKRIGSNRFSDTSLDGTTLKFDFDKGDQFIAGGDSGGPSFLDGRVAAVTSFQRWDWRSGESQFGAVGHSTRVSSFAGWIDSTVAGRYRLVLDMANQPIGNDGGHDVITLRRVGDTIRVLVNGQVLHEDSLADITGITVRGSGDGDTLVIPDVLGTSVSFDGQGGSDFLAGPYYASETGWYVTANNAGVTYPSGRPESAVWFTSVENLIGSAGADRFILSDGRGVSGSIDGGAGGDTLDYSAYGTGVYVNLGLGYGTGVGSAFAGRVLRVENVYGGAGGDTLVGSDDANTILGNGGIDYLYGRGGDDWLFGGRGDDRLFGDGGIDRLLGEEDNDILDGSRDGVRDVLVGGSGRDTFIDHQTQQLSYDPWLGWYWIWVSEDALSDLNLAEDVREIRR